jgi:hypothetical protein
MPNPQINPIVCRDHRLAHYHVDAGVFYFKCILLVGAATVFHAAVYLPLARALYDRKVDIPYTQAAISGAKTRGWKKTASNSS